MPDYFATKPELATPAPRRSSTLKRSSLKPPTAQQVKAFREKQRAKAKKIPKANVERQQRLALIRRQKHAAYRRSECYKAVEDRSGGQCERMLSLLVGGGPYYPNVTVRVRCENKRSDGLRMTHNHLSYRRYGGKELPTDVELLCPSCNAQYESQKRGNLSRKKLGSGGVHG